jgi:carbonic anhydrase/acetyltransferase-like protein (isoleucine patch superfamily)
MDRYGSSLSHDVAYRLDFSRHRQVLPLYDSIPQTYNAWVAPNATLVGNVILSRFATVWYGAVVRGDMHPVRIGHFTSVGDRTTIHTDHSLPHGLACSVNIGKNVTIGANCNIHSCIIDDDCVVGDNCIIQQGARLERGCEILPNTVVVAGSLIPAGTVWGGNPAKFVRNLSEQEQLSNYSRSYAEGAS